MNGIEVESIMFSHQFARHTDNPEIKRALALSRRSEQMQQKANNWLLPGSDGPIEDTIVYEQVAIDLTAWLARNEPDPYLKQTYEFGLLEDFDHLYRYANLLDLMKGKKAEAITTSTTEIMPGRPTQDEFRHPDDDLRRHYEKHSVDPLSRLHAMTLVAAEQQTMNYYMNVGNLPVDPLARGLYLEIGMIEEQHVTQYESLIDPLETWLEQLVFHEYLEVYLYNSFMQEETDARVKAQWELHLNMEIEQLKAAAELLRKYEGKDAAELLPPTLPAPTKFESNKEYVRQVLADQVDYRADGLDVVPAGGKLTAASERYQKVVNAGGNYTEMVIDARSKAKGDDYRLQPNGRHPIDDKPGTNGSTIDLTDGATSINAGVSNR
jgi:hypothetical protein